MKSAMQGRQLEIRSSRIRRTAMAKTVPANARPALSQLPQTAADRRKYKRIKVNLLGRFMLENKQEYPCKLLDISPGGASMIAPVIGEPCERIVAYFDHIGRIEGIITRTFESGFAIAIIATPYKREKLAAQLTWIANHKTLNLPEERRHSRIVPQNTQATIKYADGTVSQCRLLDVSLSGASIDIDKKIEIGTEVMLGRLRAVVVRHHEHGIGLKFLDIQNPTALRKYFG